MSLIIVYMQLYVTAYSPMDRTFHTQHIRLLTMHFQQFIYYISYLMHAIGLRGE